MKFKPLAINTVAGCSVCGVVGSDGVVGVGVDGGVVVCAPQRCMRTIAMVRVCEFTRSAVAPRDARTHHAYMVGCKQFECSTKSVRVSELISYKIQTDGRSQLKRTTAMRVCVRVYMAVQLKFDCYTKGG